MTPSRRTAVIGGGICGASAALRLRRRGGDVVVLEQSSQLGGLVVSFEVAGTPLECFYHHLFPGDDHLRALIDELGLTPRLEWLPSSVGVLTGERIWPFTSPLDLLRFRRLPLRDRVRTGVGALRMGRVRSWVELDELPAREWLRRYTGERAAAVLWDPLLRARFGPAAADVPAAWLWGRFQQRAGARSRGRERLGYLRGGFRQLFDALHRRLANDGVDVRTSAPVSNIVVEEGRVAGLRVSGEQLEVDSVLYAGALPGLVPLLPDHLLDDRWRNARGLGALCVVLELTRPISDVYWTNVCTDDLPFGGIIEHTNLLPRSDYGDRHVVYLSRYFNTEEAVAGADPEDEAGRWIDALDQYLPSFSAGEVIAVHPFRTGYAAPLVGTGHLRTIPPVESHVPGLFVATTAQIYPQDRGMTEGVRLGRQTAEVMTGASPATGSQA